MEPLERPIAYALRRVGYPSMTLKPEQKDCVQCIYEGKDVFVWLPTGFGKTVCFDVLPFMFEGRVGSLVVVVSPLVSLMIDQVRSLRSGSDRVWRDTDECTALLGAFQGGPGQQQDLIHKCQLSKTNFRDILFWSLHPPPLIASDIHNYSTYGRTPINQHGSSKYLYNNSLKQIVMRDKSSMMTESH